MDYVLLPNRIEYDLALVDRDVLLTETIAPLLPFAQDIAKRLGVPVFAICDTNCDPDPVDYIIPANDDAIKSVQVVTKAFADAVLEGRERAAAHQAEMAAEAENKGKDAVVEAR